MLLGVAAIVLVGLPFGLAVGTAVALATVSILGRLEPRAARARRERLEADAQLAADLMAACFLAGAAPSAAADAVASAIDGPVAVELRGVLAAVRLGSDPIAAWQSLSATPTLAGLGRAVARALDSGAPLAEIVAEQADQQREELRWAAETAARSIAVRATGPLGLCFLPGFVLLGVIPLVIAVARGVL